MADFCRMRKRQKAQGVIARCPSMFRLFWFRSAALRHSMRRTASMFRSAGDRRIRRLRVILRMNLRVRRYYVLGALAWPRLAEDLASRERVAPDLREIFPGR